MKVHVVKRFVVTLWFVHQQLCEIQTTTLGFATKNMATKMAIPLDAIKTTIVDSPSSPTSKMRNSPSLSTSKRRDLASLPPSTGLFHLKVDKEFALPFSRIPQSSKIVFSFPPSVHTDQADHSSGNIETMGSKNMETSNEDLLNNELPLINSSSSSANPLFNDQNNASLLSSQTKNIPSFLSKYEIVCIASGTILGVLGVICLIVMKNRSSTESTDSNDKIRQFISPNHIPGEEFGSSSILEISTISQTTDKQQLSQSFRSNGFSSFNENYPTSTKERISTPIHLHKISTPTPYRKEVFTPRSSNSNRKEVLTPASTNKVSTASSSSTNQKDIFTSVSSKNEFSNQFCIHQQKKENHPITVVKERELIDFQKKKQQNHQEILEEKPSSMEQQLKYEEKLIDLLPEHHIAGKKKVIYSIPSSHAGKSTITSAAPLPPPPRGTLPQSPGGALPQPPGGTSRAPPPQPPGGTSRAPPPQPPGGTSRAPPPQPPGGTSRAPPPQPPGGTSRAPPPQPPGGTSRAPPPQPPGAPTALSKHMQLDRNQLDSSTVSKEQIQLYRKELQQGLILRQKVKLQQQQQKQIKEQQQQQEYFQRQQEQLQLQQEHLQLHRGKMQQEPPQEQEQIQPPQEQELEQIQQRQQEELEQIQMQRQEQQMQQQELQQEYQEQLQDPDDNSEYKTAINSTCSSSSERTALQRITLVRTSSGSSNISRSYQDSEEFEEIVPDNRARIQSLQRYIIREGVTEVEF